LVEADDGEVAHRARNPRRAVVLAAGLGSRLGARTARVPKCLVEVNGTPIVINALERLEEAGIEETLVVVGYLEENVRQRLGTVMGRMRISYRANTEFRRTNTTYSLWLALNDVDEDIVVLEGDVFFGRRVLADFLALPYGDATLVERWNAAFDGSVVQVGPDGNVRAWIHNKDRPSGFSLEGTYKTVNIHRFSRDFVHEHLRPAVTLEVETNGGREPIETPLNDIVDAGGRIRAADVSDRWFEIDNEADLRIAEAMFQGASNGHR
jgi:choline kinase